MDRDGFTRRLTQALDLNGVERTAIERKRFLARLMQVSERHAGNYLSGTKLPTTEGMIDLARKLGVALEWLANGTLPIRPLRLTPEQVGVLERLSPEQIDRLFQIGGILAPADATDPASPLAA
jgi:transcriptional regulator with XRE-family HTH domain